MDSIKKENYNNKGIEDLLISIYLLYSYKKISDHMV